METNEDASILWGAMARLTDKISDELERIDWDKAIDMVVDAFEDASNETDTKEVFFTWYQFFFRFLHRIKKMDEPAPFNQIGKTSRLIKHDNVPMYMVSNYDYKMYKWCKSKGYINSVTNDWFLVPESSLSPSEKKRFESHLV